MMLETGRLIIREFEAEDFQAVHVYASDPLVATYMIWGPNTEQETRTFMEHAARMRQQSPRVDYELAVVLKASRELIGGCGLHVSEPSQGEIGYCFNPRYWRQGYASEAARELLRFGFGQLGLHRVYATCRPGNAGSAKVMESIGMKYEGHWREHMRHKGAWHDSFQYSILEQEYRRGRGADNDSTELRLP